MTDLSKFSHNFQNSVLAENHYSFRDERPLACFSVPVKVRNQLVENLNSAQEWAVGRRCGLEALEFKRFAGRHWRELIGETGQWVVDLKVKGVRVSWVYLGQNKTSRMSVFEIENIEFFELKNKSSISDSASKNSGVKDSIHTASSHNRFSMATVLHVRTWLLVPESVTPVPAAPVSL